MRLSDGPLADAVLAAAAIPGVLPPRQVALEKTFMEVTRDAADDRTPATSGEPAAAAFVLRRREG